MTPGRRAALEALRAVRSGELADLALGRVLEEIPARDRPWTQELVFGTFRFRGRLDYILDRLVRRGIASLDPGVLDCLRLGAYQLLEMGSVPAYAAVSQSVELAKGVAGRGAAGLVNGVLKALGRSGAEVEFPDPGRDPVGFLSSWGSHPRWLVERWIDRFGADGARRLVDANNRRPELYIRPIRTSIDEARERLAEAGIETDTVELAPDALRVRPPATARDALAAVRCVVQDPAAGLVVRYAAVPPGARVADLCAAPGGKAIELAVPSRYLVAADLSFRRLERVCENADRVGGLPIGPIVADARWPPVRPVEAVLVDAPCTGTGTLRRHPDGKWRIGPRDLEALVALQREILEAAAGVVAPGGLLIYATCSLEPEENERQVEAFLDRHPEFELEPPAVGTVDRRLLDTEGRLVVLPQELDVDGAFSARLRRKN